MLGFMKGSLQGCRGICRNSGEDTTFFGNTNATEKYVSLSNIENKHDNENPIFIH